VRAKIVDFQQNKTWLGRARFYSKVYSLLEFSLPICIYIHRKWGVKVFLTLVLFWATLVLGISGYYSGQVEVEQTDYLL
jgi:hypothetical protein